jgi:hypothetical protein
MPIFRELLNTSQATHIEAQTNIPFMLLMLHDCATNVVAEKILFHDAFTTRLTCTHAVFRQSIPDDAASIFLINMNQSASGLWKQTGAWRPPEVF